MKPMSVENWRGREKAKVVKETQGIEFHVSVPVFLALRRRKTS